MPEVTTDQTDVNEQPYEIEVTLKEFDKLVEDKKALDRLLANPDYIRIINEMYIEEEKGRLVGLLGSRNRAAVAEEGIIVCKIKAKAYLEQFMEATAQALAGIDNPEQRVELVNQLNDIEEN